MRSGPDPIPVGVGLAVAAAVSFGLTSPLVQRAGVGMGSFTTAALLYGGAALFAAIPGRGAGGIPLGRGHLRPLLGMALCGAFLAPVLLAAGLQRASGTAASLLLNLEAVFTVVLGAWVHGEAIGRRVGVAVGVIAAGGALIGLGSVSGGGAGDLAGLALVAGATGCWAIDNTLSRALAEVEPRVVVLAKGSAGAALSLGLARLTGEPPPAVGPALVVAVCGAIGYGASLRLYLRAQRILGSARTGSVFAVAPFVGAALALVLGEGSGGWLALLGGAAMAFGVWLHLTEQHDHAHTHPALTHTHTHRHDDGHHDDHHHPGLPPGTEHVHPHTHALRAHQHPHAEDIHHQHHG